MLYIDTKLCLLPLGKKILNMFEKSSYRTTEEPINGNESYNVRISVICTCTFGWLIHGKYDEKYMEFARDFMNMALQLRKSRTADNFQDIRTVMDCAMTSFWQRLRTILTRTISCKKIFQPWNISSKTFFHKYSKRWNTNFRVGICLLAWTVILLYTEVFPPEILAHGIVMCRHPYHLQWNIYNFNFVT